MEAENQSTPTTKYLLAFQGGWDEFEQAITAYFADLEIDPDDYDPLDKRTPSILAYFTSSFEIELTLRWEQTTYGFFVAMEISELGGSIGILDLHELIAIPAQKYFNEVILVFNALGHKRVLLQKMETKSKEAKSG